MEACVVVIDQCDVDKPPREQDRRARAACSATVYISEPDGRVRAGCSNPFARTASTAHARIDRLASASLILVEPARPSVY